MNRFVAVAMGLSAIIGGLFAFASRAARPLPEAVFIGPDQLFGMKWYLLLIDLAAEGGVAKCLRENMEKAGLQDRLGRIVRGERQHDRKSRVNYAEDDRYESSLGGITVAPRYSYLLVELDLDDRVYKIVRNSYGVSQFGIKEHINSYFLHGKDPLTYIPHYGEYREPTVDYHAF